MSRVSGLGLGLRFRAATLSVSVSGCRAFTGVDAGYLQKQIAFVGRYIQQVLWLECSKGGTTGLGPRGIPQMLICLRR